MRKKTELIKILKNQVLYSLPSLALLNDKFIDGIDWPADKETLVFLFPEKEAGSGKPVRDMVSKKRYVCSLTYMADKKNIQAGKTDGAASGFVLKPFKDQAEHRKWASATEQKYFSGIFKDYQTPSSAAEAKEYYKCGLPKAKGISVLKEGKIVSMLTLYKVTKKSAHRPLHWITWIWADPVLPKEERRAVHALLRGWVRKNSGGYVGASVLAANLKSQNWFLKSGFRPSRISFTRRAA
jgi:hypothetical protein